MAERQVRPANSTYIHGAFALIERDSGGTHAFLNVDSVIRLLEDLGEPLLASSLRARALEAQLAVANHLPESVS